MYDFTVRNLGHIAWHFSESYCSDAVPEAAIESIHRVVNKKQDTKGLITKTFYDFFKIILS